MNRLRKADVIPLAALFLITWSALPVVNVAYAKASTSAATVHYRYADIDGMKVFYREAGPVDGPAVVLLHGFPTSSHMFRNLIPMLSDSYHVIAPDYPGFGQSDVPDRAKYQYTFGGFADIVDKLLQQRSMTRYALYVMDYGAPVGYRLALKHLQRVSALIVQNGNAYEEGLRDFWIPVKAFWKDPSAKNRAVLAEFLKPEITIFQYTDGVSDRTRISPDNWVHDQALLDRPGIRDIQLDVMYDYRTNVQLYPRIQQYFRDHKPPAILVWGRNDKIFPEEGALPYRRDLPDIEFHLFDTGHFALEDKLDEIGPLIRDFLDRKVKP